MKEETRMSRSRSANYDQVFLFPPALEDWIPAQHPARFVREVVDSLDLDSLGFQWGHEGEDGRPRYALDLMLKVWLYGWMEGVRSTRLERGCAEAVGLIWLAGMMTPDHNTLWRFWRDNRKAMKALLKKVVGIAVDAGVVGAVLHAVDGTKIAAVSSRRP